MPTVKLLSETTPGAYTEEWVDRALTDDEVANNRAVDKHVATAKVQAIEHEFHNLQANGLARKELKANGRV